MLSVAEVLKPRRVEFSGGVFLIKHLSGLGSFDFTQRCRHNSSKGLPVVDKDTAENVLRECLIGWESVVDSDGPIAFTFEIAMEVLGIDILEYLLKDIFDNINMSADVSKKS